MEAADLKAVPLVVGFCITFLLPKLIDDKTEQYAVQEQLIAEGNKDQQDTLEYLNRWRDGSLALLTGLFVVEFAAAEDLGAGGRLGTLAIWTTIGIIPMVLLVGLIWVRSLRPRAVQSRLGYGVVILLVACLYVVAGLFAYKPGAG